MIATKHLQLFFGLACITSSWTAAFLTKHLAPTSGVAFSRRQRPTVRVGMSDGQSQSEIELFLSQAYPSFYGLLISNSEEVVKALRQNAVFTIFAPNEAAFAELGDKKVAQLGDPRNLETSNKVAAYHVVVDDFVTAERILQDDTIGGVLTLGGEVAIGPSMSGGLFGMGAKEDGGVAVGSAKIVQSTDIGQGVVHEVDGLISPTILWRYFDQLRMPGL